MSTILVGLIVIIYVGLAFSFSPTWQEGRAYIVYMNSFPLLFFFFYSVAGPRRHRQLPVTDVIITQS